MELYVAFLTAVLTAVVSGIFIALSRIAHHRAVIRAEQTLKETEKLFLEGQFHPTVIRPEAFVVLAPDKETVIAAQKFARVHGYAGPIDGTLTPALVKVLEHAEDVDVLPSQFEHLLEQQTAQEARERLYSYAEKQGAIGKLRFSTSFSRNPAQASK